MTETLPSASPVLVRIEEAVGIVRLHRPRVRNALNLATMAALVDALDALERDGAIRVIVLTGDDRAFAAGADIAEMSDATAIEMLQRPNQERWEKLRRIRKPLIAAVSGYALGGGCELAMACDMIVAAESSKFGQPEIKLGLIPGGGGTQRLVRAVGKARAMELILTGRMMTASEAHEAGLVTSVVPDELYFEEAMRLARTIASRSPLAVRLAKESVLKAFDSGLESGLDFERRSFSLLFASDDAREGMRAFLEKREPRFSGR